MPFTLLHEYFYSELTVHILTSAENRTHHTDDENGSNDSDDNGYETARVSCELSGELAIGFPGRLIIGNAAFYWLERYVDGRWGDALFTTFPLTVEIRTPDGQLFTADRVTLDDLRRFRDLRGTSQGSWTFNLYGQTDITVNEEDPQDGDSRVRPGGGSLWIAVEETVLSKSAPPLIADTLTQSQTRRYHFDLFRIGTLVARAMSRPGMPGVPTRKQLTLYDPDGAVVATGNGGLQFPVTLRTLDKSRDANGDPRLWTLEAGEHVGPLSGLDVDVSATVIAETRLSLDVLHKRIVLLIGEYGEKIYIYGETQGDDIHVRLKILDEVSAETIDMWGLLDSVVGTKDIAANVAYDLFHHSRVFGPAIHGEKVISIDLDNAKVSYIDVSIGASEAIHPSMPALKINVGVENRAYVFASLEPVATVQLGDDGLRLEIGIGVADNGAVQAALWINDEPIEVDPNWLHEPDAAVKAYIELSLERDLNSAISAYLIERLSRAGRYVSRVLAALLGDDFTYRSVRLDGEDLVFSYVAPLEPDPKPSEGYVGIIGRSAVQTSPTAWEMTPPTLGDTWSAQNLAKIDHIVVVMMENRSFDHVLGYRAQLPWQEDSDGLTAELMGFLESPHPPFDKGFAIPKLKDSDIPENSVGKKTALPRHVGHGLSDVSQQLSKWMQTPEGRYINSPKGFIDNFNEERAGGLAREDVLGYYEADDLPFFGFLAENYAYCEKYFCSHPGPTLPNRMFSLAGDVQYDGSGEAILDNNKGDNFYLSRAPTIFDLLTRRGIGWRVYESFPSITMLRMFARYAGDNTNIVPLGEHASRLKEDVARHAEILFPFPSVVFIDPAFHHYPQSDDHPEDARERPAVDMWRGQQFLKDIYDALVSNRELWSKTLLIITYDEHGGFYDHVIPPLADGLFQPPVMARGGMGTAVSSMEIRYGVRVPTFVVSPWVPAGKRLDIVLDHCSILKTIIARFLGTRRYTGPPHRRLYYSYPFLSDRVHASRSFDAYLTATEPRLDVPASPDLALLARETPRGDRTIITDVLSRAQMRRGNVNFHDLTGRLARQLGR
jgi:phospholipase C